MTATTEVTPVRTSAVNPGPLGLLAEAAREAWSRRMLIRYLVLADLRKKGADTLLGNVWWLLDPLLQLAVYVLLVQVIFSVRIEDYPLFIFAAILPWKWFNSAVNDAILSVTSQERLIKQVKFPKLVLPTAAVVAGITNFVFGFAMVLVLMVLFYADRLSVHLAWVPLVAVVQLVFTLAVAFVVSSVNVFFRDVGNIARHGLRIWFYLSPGLWSLDRISAASETLATITRFNPFTILFEGYRAAMYGTGDGGPNPPDFAALGILFVVSLVLLAVGTIFFKRLEPSFAKVL